MSLLQMGIGARPVRSGVTSLRPNTLLTRRSTTPKFGLGLGGGGASASPLSLGAPSPMSVASPGTDANGTPASVLLPPRENPHQLFIKQPLPSTTAAGSGSSLTPSRSSGGGAGGSGSGAARAAATPATPATAAGGAGPSSNGAAGGGGGASASPRTPAGAATTQGAPHTPAGGEGGSSQGASGAAAAAVAADKYGRGNSGAPLSNGMYGSVAAAAPPGSVEPPEVPTLGALAEEGYKMQPSQAELEVSMC